MEERSRNKEFQDKNPDTLAGVKSKDEKDRKGKMIETLGNL